MENGITINQLTDDLLRIETTVKNAQTILTAVEVINVLAQKVEELQKTEEETK